PGSGAGGLAAWHRPAPAARRCFRGPLHDTSGTQGPARSGPGILSPRTARFALCGVAMRQGVTGRPLLQAYHGTDPVRPVTLDTSFGPDRRDSSPNGTFAGPDTAKVMGSAPRQCAARLTCRHVQEETH